MSSTGWIAMGVRTGCQSTAKLDSHSRSHGKLWLWLSCGYDCSGGRGRGEILRDRPPKTKFPNIEGHNKLKV